MEFQVVTRFPETPVDVKHTAQKLIIHTPQGSLAGVQRPFEYCRERELVATGCP